MRRNLLLGALLVLCAVTLVTCDLGGSPTPTWTGAFYAIRGGTGGLISNWTFDSDGTTRGVWVTDDAISIQVRGDYSLYQGYLWVMASGTASNGSSTCPYNMTVDGTLEGSSGYGTYSIDFSAPWSFSSAGTWSITKK